MRASHHQLITQRGHVHLRLVRDQAGHILAGQLDHDHVLHVPVGPLGHTTANTDDGFASAVDRFILPSS